MLDCLFCKIAAGDIPCTKVFENEKILAFRDINPQAPEHIVIIPKKHYATILDVPAEDKIVSDIAVAVCHIAKELGIDETGFRVVNNCKEDGGQTVGHLHFHLLGGRSLQWPPG